jgi:hypothetical protein
MSVGGIANMHDIAPKDEDYLRFFPWKENSLKTVFNGSHYAIFIPSTYSTPSLSPFPLPPLAVSPAPTVLLL